LEFRRVLFRSRRQRARAIMPPRERRERARLRHGKAARGPTRAALVGPPEVVEDGVRPVEALSREALLVAQRPIRAAERDVRLLRDVAFDAPLDPGASPFVCARSMLSKSARKFPSPNPGSPLRWMIS